MPSDSFIEILEAAWTRPAGEIGFPERVWRWFIGFEPGDPAENSSRLSANACPAVCLQGCKNRKNGVSPEVEAGAEFEIEIPEGLPGPDVGAFSVLFFGAKRVDMFQAVRKRLFGDIRSLFSDSLHESLRFRGIVLMIHIPGENGGYRSFRVGYAVT